MVQEDRRPQSLDVVLHWWHGLRGVVFEPSPSKITATSVAVSTSASHSCNTPLKNPVLECEQAFARYFQRSFSWATWVDGHWIVHRRMTAVWKHDVQRRTDTVRRCMKHVSDGWRPIWVSHSHTPLGSCCQHRSAHSCTVRIRWRPQWSCTLDSKLRNVTSMETRTAIRQQTASTCGHHFKHTAADAQSASLRKASKGREWRVGNTGQR